MKGIGFFLIVIISFVIFTRNAEARFYDPQTGRFLSEDPIGFEGGDTNLSIYGGNNPVNNIDPSGLYSWSDVLPAWSHYCDGTQTPWTTDINSINWGDIQSRVNTLIKGMVGGSCRNTTIPVNQLLGAQAAGADSLIIFRHTLNITGQIQLRCDCSWTFTGSMQSYRGYDPYNFNPSNRGIAGEASTWVGRNRCPGTGKTFNINITGSETLAFSGKGGGIPTCDCKN